MESLRAGRTRYLVVVSRPASKSKPQSPTNAQQQVPVSATNSPTLSSRSASNMTTKTSSTSLTSTTATTSTSRIQTTEVTTSHPNTENIYHQSSINQNNNDFSSNISISTDTTNSYFNEFSNDKVNSGKSNLNINNDNKNCDENLGNMRKYETNSDSSNSNINAININMSNNSEIEESCLLGIDCNERTTVGLVLKVMADTSIRLDGDG